MNNLLNDPNEGFTVNKSLEGNSNDLLEIVKRAFKVQSSVDGYKKEISELNHQIELSNKRIIELESQLAHFHKKHFQSNKDIITETEWDDACRGLGRKG